MADGDKEATLRSSKMHNKGRREVGKSPINKVASPDSDLTLSRERSHTVRESRMTSQFPIFILFSEKKLEKIWRHCSFVSENVVK